MNELLEKLKSVLEEKDLLDFKVSYDNKLAEQVSIKLEEAKKELEVTLKAEADKKLSESVEAEKARLDEEYTKKLDELEAHLVDQIDLFIESEVLEKIGPDLIDKAAINETAMPIVEAIKVLFEEKFVALDTEGHGLLKKKTEEAEARTKELSEAIASKMELSEKVDVLNKQLLLAEKTAELNESQKKRLSDYFGEKDFAYTAKNIDSVMQLIVEDTNKSKEPVKNLNENTDPVATEEDSTKPALDESTAKVQPVESFLSKVDQFL